MSTSLLERTRAAHEDVELFERAIVESLLTDARSHRENVQQAHWANTFTEKIQDRLKTLVKIYKDEDGARQAEISAMGGKGAQLFSEFYDQLRQIRDYHRKFPTLVPERPEAEQMLNSMDIDDIVHFTAEEGFGRFLDLHALYEKYLNLPGLPDEEKPQYLTYLESFYTFPSRSINKYSPAYSDYLKQLMDYLVSFFRRAQPLFNLDASLLQFETDFNRSWEDGSFVPVGYNDEDRERDENPLWDKYSQKLFTNENVFKSYKNGKKYQKNVQSYNTVFKELMLLETKINRMASLLEEVIEATRMNVERKLARTADEAEYEKEGEDDMELEGEEEDENEVEEVKLSKQNYPTDHLGNPIPFWLYKLHGLGIEYKCEICGNMSYWGRRAFEKHFGEWRHNHGLKCLRIEPSKEFNEVTRIADALELNKQLKEKRAKETWDGEVMEEFEDSEGNVMNRKTFRDLIAQGLI